MPTAGPFSKGAPVSINLLTVLEDMKVPSWFPGRWPDILFDLLYYDAGPDSVSPAE